MQADAEKRRQTKIYVTVDARFAPDGGITPLSVKWADGRVFGIDEIRDVRRAASLKAGGLGMRYTVRIGRSVTYLFLEQDRWFVEAK